MNPLKSFEEFEKAMIVKKVAPNISRANSLIHESKKRKKFIKEMKEKIGVTDENADYYIENVYDTIMALIRAKMFLRGFRASGNGVHEAEVSYTRKLKFTEQETRFLNEIRYWRNQIVYYGKELTKKYAQKVILFMEKICSKEIFRQLYLQE
ncbi:MAG: hypothetical protein ABIC91_05570 [Nanoarchaeota archaeon]|nr:hypothetical protein [Nanoarchaeota archaeon]MBU1029721.1 hypothetical protein [Nanoarchaeota archaeon]MBU1849417.1 hypothetical protein [Nanoarchaeota archaeon]